MQLLLNKRGDRLIWVTASLIMAMFLLLQWVVFEHARPVLSIDQDPVVKAVYRDAIIGSPASLVVSESRRMELEGTKGPSIEVVAHPAFMDGLPFAVFFQVPSMEIGTQMTQLLIGARPDGVVFDVDIIHPGAPEQATGLHHRLSEALLWSRLDERMRPESSPRISAGASKSLAQAESRVLPDELAYIVAQLERQMTEHHLHLFHLGHVSAGQAMDPHPGRGGSSAMNRQASWILLGCPHSDDTYTETI